ncbi:ATP-dependent helicase [Leifsonia sp. A12D58]|uniref:ATP-dependent helicase n=1 Tax=Leifsonia sp. A12D58 TaxID=3397674 RepID=UPI0039DF93B5
MINPVIATSAEAAPATPLDPSQSAILGLADGESAAVIGAAGTGKTLTMLEIIADRVLNRGYSPSDILALVPTRTGATSLRDTIALRLGVPTNGPLARTPNSVAFQIVRNAATAAGDGAPTLLTGGEQDQIIAELLQGDIDDATGPTWPSQLGPDVRSLRGFRTELRDLMMRAVEYGVTPPALAALGRTHKRQEWVAAAEFIAGYEEVKDLARPNQYDSTELAQYAAALVQAAPRTGSADALGPLAGVRLILLDDAQEATQATLTLLAQFAARGVAIIALGDPDLSTGSFRGAHPDSLGRLGSYLGTGPVQTFVLDTVYRHGGAVRSAVIEASSRIGTAGAGTQRKAQLSVVGAAGDEDADTNTESSIVETVIAASPAEQLAVIARRLRERHVIDRVPWGEMAVIVRSGSLVPSLSKGLAALEVPTSVSSATTALRDEFAVRAFITALDVTFGRRRLDGPTAVELLSGPLAGLDPIALRRLRAALRQEELDADGDRSAEDLLVEALMIPGSLATIDTRVARKAAAFGASLREAAADQAAGATIEELLWGLWTRSGLADVWFEQSQGTGIVAEEANHNLDAVVALFSSAQRFVERTPGMPPVLFLEHLVDTDVPEDTLAPRALSDAVMVSTPPGTIGTDFQVVVVAGVQDNVWPDLRIRGSLLGAGDLAAVLRDEVDVDARAQVLHDELRMFAQALSRSRHEVLVTAVKDEDSQPSAFFRMLPEPDPSQVSRYPMSLRGMVGRLRRDLTGALRPSIGTQATVYPTRAMDAAATLARLAHEDVVGADPSAWYGMSAQSTLRPLNDLEAGDGPVRVSPSKMKSFETCPLHWLIDQIGGGTSNTAANLGTIIHSVMEEASLAAMSAPDAPSGAVFSSEALWQSVESRWGELAFDAPWQSEVQKKEARRLTDRLASYLGDFTRDGSTLLSAEGRFAFDVGGAILSGTVDRVEQQADGTALIVDLKTGKGDPINDAGVIDHPQLGAYQLAFRDGQIAGVPEGSELAGARLAIVSSGTVKQNYRNPTQKAFTPDELAAFRQRVLDDAVGMGDAVFLAEIANHCLDPWSFGSCRLHVVKQVSS